MKLSNMKDGEFLYSKVTSILYTRKKGVLMKFPFYDQCDPTWTEAAYRLDGNHFGKPNQQMIDYATKPKPRPKKKKEQTAKERRIKYGKLQ